MKSESSTTEQREQLVLISALGAPKLRASEKEGYKTTRYRFQNQESDKWVTPLSALVELFKPDRVFALCTTEAEEAFHFMKIELTEKKLIQEKNIICVPIPIPRDSKSIDEVIKRVIQSIGGVKRIHLDLTFGLRSISYLGFLLFHLLDTMGNVFIERLTYMNFEASDPEYPDLHEVLDLTDYMKLPRLAYAGNELIRHGDVGFLAETIEKLYPKTFKENELKETHKYQERLYLLRTNEIWSETGKKIVRDIKKVFGEKVKNNILMTPLQDKIEDILSPMDPGELDKFHPMRFYVLAKWLLDHRKPVDAILLISEALCYLCAKNILSISNYEGYYLDGKKEKRSAVFFITDACALLKKKKKMDLARKITELREKLHGDGGLRNVIAHAGIVKTSSNVNFNAIEKVIKEFKDIAKAISEIDPYRDLIS
jgi:hypothetical protein